MKCEEAQDFITALVDNELASGDRRSVEDHLRECRTCRFIREQQTALKSEVRAAGASIAAPADLRKKILAGRRRPSMNRGEGDESAAWNRLALRALRPAFALFIVVVLVFPAIHRWWPAKDLALAALETHAGIVSGKMDLLKAEDPGEVERQMARSVAGRFEPMGYDLSMAGVRPVGGMLRKVRGRKILAMAYQGEGAAITCFTFLGTEDDAPPGSEIHFDAEKRMNFYTFSEGGVHGVLHREGEVICILVSRMPMADLLAVARAKARPA